MVGKFFLFIFIFIFVFTHSAFILPDIIYAKLKGQPVHLRTTNLPNAPNSIACNADGSMLAVNYTLQGYGVLDIYHVPSFATSVG